MLKRKGDWLIAVRIGIIDVQYVEFFPIKYM